MKTINTYILEKLKINKDSKLDNIIYNGDDISILEIYYNNLWDDTIYININRLFKVKEVDDNKIIYISPYNDNEIEQEYYTNSKNYYQSDIKESGGKNSGRIYKNIIYMQPKKCKQLIELILKEKVFNPKYSKEGNKKIVDTLINDYFDNVNIDELKNKTIKYYDCTHKGFIEPFTRPKELKEILTGYYAKY